MGSTIMYMLMPTAPSWETLRDSLSLEDFGCLRSAQGLSTKLEEIELELLAQGDPDMHDLPNGQSKREMFSIAPKLRRFTAYTALEAQFHPRFYAKRFGTRSLTIWRWAA